MAAPKNAGRLSEIEYCMDSYFRTNIVPIMNAERGKLQSAQAKDVADYSKSFAGIMRQATNASNPFAGDDTMQYLRMTGKENGKTAARKYPSDIMCQLAQVNLTQSLKRLYSTCPLLVYSFNNA